MGSNGGTESIFVLKIFIIGNALRSLEIYIMKIYHISQEQPWLFPVEEISEVTGIGPKVFEAEKIMENALHDEDVVLLFHSGTSDQDEDIVKYGLIAQFGEWVEEVLHGATDDMDAIQSIKSKSEAVFLSRMPSWITIKVARKMEKSFQNVTLDDIRECGQLCLVTVYNNSSDIYEATEDGIYRGYVESWWGSSLENDQVPFGVETGDIFSTGNVGVDITLTGNDLVMFMQRNFPDEIPDQ